MAKEFNDLPKDVVRKILWEYLANKRHDENSVKDPWSVVACLRAAKLFHVLQPYQKDLLRCYYDFETTKNDRTIAELHQLLCDLSKTNFTLFLLNCSKVSNNAIKYPLEQRIYYNRFTMFEQYVVKLCQYGMGEYAIHLIKIGQKFFQFILQHKDELTTIIEDNYIMSPTAIDYAIEYAEDCGDILTKNKLYEMFNE